MERSLWRHFDVLLYDLTSTYFEGEVQEVDKAQRGYSRDHRPDCKQIIIALIVTPEGFPLSYEVFAGNRADVTTLEEMLDAVERKHGRARRVWVFDRGIVSEENLQSLRRAGASYLVGTPRAQLKAYERRLLEGDWQRVSGEVEVQLIAQDKETYVLPRSQARAQKESAMRLRVVRGLMRDLIRLRRLLRHGRLKDPAKLWSQYIQLTEVEAVIRALKSDLAIRPIWHFTPKRVEAHVMVAFLGYLLVGVP